MSRIRVTKDNRCIVCGAKQAMCVICKQPFHARNEDHVICSDRCRKRKSRQRAIEELPTIEDLFADKEGGDSDA